MNAAFGFVPLALLLASCRSEHVFRRIDPSFNRMQVQPRSDPYDESRLFSDGSTMRAPPEGTRPYASTPADPLVVTGRCGAAPVDSLPVPLTRSLLERGRGRFGVFCAPCHGVLGDGDSVVATHMARRPPSLHEARIRALADGNVFGVVTDGYGFMPGYRAELSSEDRWAVVAYVRALERSRHAPMAELPPDIAHEAERRAE